MGYNDILSEGNFSWTSGINSSYSNWNVGEPNNSGGNEDCGQLNRFSGGTWNDEPCTLSLQFVCEYYP